MVSKTNLKPHFVFQTISVKILKNKKAYDIFILRSKGEQKLQNKSFMSKSSTFLFA